MLPRHLRLDDVTDHVGTTLSCQSQLACHRVRSTSNRQSTENCCSPPSPHRALAGHAAGCGWKRPARVSPMPSNHHVASTVGFPPIPAPLPLTVRVSFPHPAIVRRHVNQCGWSWSGLVSLTCSNHQVTSSIGFQQLASQSLRRLLLPPCHREKTCDPML